MGIAFSGMTLGGAVMTIVASHAIASNGWRFGYVTLALPILLIVVPLIVIFIRNRNLTEARESVDGASAGPAVQIEGESYELPGLELAQVTRTRSFWLICAAQLFAGSSLGLGPHFVAYLTGIGYSATFAATVVSLYLLMTTTGILLGGPLADRLTSRIALTGTYFLASLGSVVLLTAAHPVALAISDAGQRLCLGRARSADAAGDDRIARRQAAWLGVRSHRNLLHAWRSDKSDRHWPHLRCDR